MLISFFTLACLACCVACGLNLLIFTWCGVSIERARMVNDRLAGLFLICVSGWIAAAAMRLSGLPV